MSTRHAAARTGWLQRRSPKRFGPGAMWHESGRMARAIALIAILAAALVTASEARGPVATLHFRVLAHTGIRLTDVAWTGNQLLYLENTTNTVFSAPPTGKPLTQFASMPREVE